MASTNKQARKRFAAARQAAAFQPPSGVPDSIMSKGGGAAIELGQRSNTTTQGPRAGRQFREIVAGGKSYHVYDGPDGKREVVAVAAPSPDRILPRLLQQQSVGGPVKPPVPQAPIRPPAPQPSLLPTIGAAAPMPKANPFDSFQRLMNARKRRRG